jgi:hypothetical protein
MEERIVMPLSNAESVENRLELAAPPPTLDWAKWFSRLDDCMALTNGWNGYTATAPNAVSIENARHFLEAMQSAGYEPTRVAPSAMGGVAITRKMGDKKVFVEFYNDAKAYALFSNCDSKEMDVEPLAIDPSGFRDFIAKMREYLNG